MPKQFRKQFQSLGYRTSSWFRRNSRNKQKQKLAPLKPTKQRNILHKKSDLDHP